MSSEASSTSAINIDGQCIVITDEQILQARQQLALPAGFHLVEATCFLQHDTGNGVVRIPLPGGQVVAAFESLDGRRCYGVVTIDGLGS